MNYFSLAAALILPWITGIFTLASLQRSNSKNNHSILAGQIGYGFFIGYLILYGLIRLSFNLTGNLELKWVMGALVSLSLLALLVIRYRRKGHFSHPTLTNTSNPSVWEKVAFTTLIILTATHLVFNLLETIWTPLLPWDAFSAWTHVAKVWFYTGELTDFVPAAQWLAQPDSPAYTSHAYNYPIFSSLMQLWTAVGLGSWSETLINLPQLLCGLAIGMALFSECRQQGASRLISLSVCYLFLSIPLINTHLSLGGYADIWLAGFTGLGFVKLITGLKEQQPIAITGGLLLIATATLIKNEGLIWFLLALLTTAIFQLSSRQLLTTLALTSAAILACLLLETTSLELGTLGRVGYFEGKIFAPNMPGLTFQYHNVWPAYFKNFFLMGSWNLLWLLVFTSLVTALIPPYTPTKKLVTTFVLIFLAGQFFIFFLTDQARWAEKYTALNRLPLHFSPALIYACFLLWHDQLKLKTEKQATSNELHNS